MGLGVGIFTGGDENGCSLESLLPLPVEENSTQQEPILKLLTKELANLDSEIYSQEYPLVVSTNPDYIRENYGSGFEDVNFVHAGNSMGDTIIHTLMGLVNLNLDCPAESELELNKTRLKELKHKINKENLDDRIMFSFSDMIAPSRLYDGFLASHLRLEKLTNKRIDFLVGYVSRISVDEYLIEHGANPNIRYFQGGDTGSGVFLLEGSMSSQEMREHNLKHFYNVTGRQYPQTEMYVNLGMFITRMTDALDNVGLELLPMFNILRCLRHSTKKDVATGLVRLMAQLTRLSLSHPFFLPKALISTKRGYDSWRNSAIAREKMPYEELLNLAKHSTSDMYYGSLSNILNLNIASVLLPEEFSLGAIDIDYHHLDQNHAWYQANYYAVAKQTIEDVDKYIQELPYIEPLMYKKEIKKKLKNKK